MAEGALVQEMVRLLCLHVRDAEHGGRVPRRGAPAAHRHLCHAGCVLLRGGAWPASLRAAAAAVAAREHRREVGVAEGVEVGGRELHRPASLGTASRFPELARRRRRRDDGSCAWREQGGGVLS